MRINAIEIKQVDVKIKKNTILKNISLEIEEGKCIALLGPSGSGKTTLLRVIAGFTPPSKGEVMIFGKRVTHTPPEERDVSMLFQEPVLFSHLSVLENATIGFSKKQREITKPYDIKRLSKAFEIEEFKKRKIKDGLSGGEKQRAALLRTFANAKCIVLLDEPLKSALNAELKWKLMRSIKNIIKEKDRTTIFVTHDFEEASYIADEIAVIASDGSGIFQGKTSEIYNNPPNLQVARVLGKGTELEAEIILLKEKRETICPILFTDGAPKLIPEAHTIFIRPNKIDILINGIGFIVKSVVFQGEYILTELKPKNSNDFLIFATSNAFPDIAINKEVGIQISKHSLIIFNNKGKRIYDI